MATESLRGKQILRRMAAVYATCTSYSDTGVVSTRFFQAKGDSTVEKPFATAFVRPDRFRFEFQDGPRRRFVWREGETVRVEWASTGLERLRLALMARSLYRQLLKPESLKLALAGMTGISGSSAHTIPTLLLPEEIGGRRLTELTSVQRIDDALLTDDGVACYRIAGQYAFNPTVLWIEKATFCLRRIEAQTQFEHFRTETTTIYRPSLNAEIGDDLLCYNRSHA